MASSSNLEKEEGWQDIVDQDSDISLPKKTNTLNLQTTRFEPLTAVKDPDVNLVQSPTTISTTSDFTTLVPEDEKSKWKTAWEESRHFMGGLIRHPYESTKHYSILRHSHGLVYYKGATTSIAITIFADRLLPAGRRLFLQNRGWSGKRGMRVKAAFRMNNSWIEVTPARQVEATALPPADERAWQRDIEHFLKKVPKNLLEHRTRETAVVRIPHEAQDGYFHVVLTGPNDQKVLCASPSFRVASTSMSASSIRGASLSTLPIELSIKAGSMIANTMASSAISPLRESVQAQVEPYVPSYAQTVGTTAYDMSGIPDKVGALEEQYERAREKSLGPDATSAAADQGFDEPCLVGEHTGPQPPFPIKIRSKVIKGTGRGTTESGFPTANLATSPQELAVHLQGTYCGWATVKNSENPESDGSDHKLQDWKAALIIVGVCPYTAPSVAPRELIKVHLITSVPSFSSSSTQTRPSFFSIPPFSLVTILILCSVPTFPSSIASDPSSLITAMLTAQLSLYERPNWDVESALQIISERKKARSFNEKYVDARQKGQKWVERVPVHRIGIRTASAGIRERMVLGNREGKGGLWVNRDGD